MNKNLVVFFTHRGETYFPDGYRVVEKGNAEKLAEMVSKIIPADTFEIKTEKKIKNVKLCAHLFIIRFISKIKGLLVSK